MVKQDTLKSQKQQQYYPLGSFLILSITGILSLLMFISGKSNDYRCDTNLILHYGQYYRLFTSLYAVYTWRDLIYWLLCTIWLIFQLPKFEKRVSTIYTLFHFLKANFIVQGVILLITLSNYMIKHNRINPITGVGIYPYTIYLFLRNSQIKKQETVFCFCFPIPVNKITRAFLASLFFISISPQYLIMSFLSLYWNVTRFEFIKKCILREGPLIPRIVKFLQWIFPFKSKRFVTLTKIQYQRNKNSNSDSQQVEEKVPTKKEVQVSQQIS